MTSAATAPSRRGRLPVAPAADPRLSALLGRSATMRRIARATRLPRLLHHYTGAATLASIVLGAPFDPLRRRAGDPLAGATVPCLRATHLRFMNDRSELKLATALMDRELERHGRRRGRLAARLGSVRESLARLSDEPWIWAVSWSERGNQLSQWRAYAGGVGGYSIGVPVPWLQRMAAWQGFVLCPCVYREDLQRRIVSETVAGFVEGIGRARPDDALRTRRFAQDLLFLAATMKHPGFEEEREWRLILRAPPEEAGTEVDYLPRRHFHATAYGLASWVPFWLRDGSRDELRGLRVVVGPADDADARVASTRALLADTPGLDGEVEASGIPLRL